MIPLTDTCHIKRHWFVVMLLSLIFLTGATWYFTPEPQSRPMKAQIPTPENPGVTRPPVGGRYSDEKQVPIATNTAFAPFLHIVPSQDGTELLISAGNPEVGGTVFANIGVGPGNEKGGWTMSYSDTIDAYVTTAPGFTPGMDTYAPLSITTTLGLDTGTVDFNRAYIPASTSQIIDSVDGNLRLTIVSTDTFPSEAYVAVAPSYGAPGPAPQDHQFVGSVYSVRASGAILVADRPMSLRLSYDDITLAGADPHTLAIFAWDAFNKRWDNLGGTLFTSPEKYVSVATSRFTTYALMATPSWRDEFDDFSGLDFAQINNVTLGGSLENRALVLVSTATGGSAVSLPITPTIPIINWGNLTFTHTVNPPTTTLTVDVLSLDGTEVLTDVASGTNLAGLVDPVQYPSLRLRVNMSSTTGGETPALEQWQLAWQTAQSPPPGDNKIYLPVVIKSGP